MKDSVYTELKSYPRSTFTSRAAVVSIFAIALTKLVPIVVGSEMYPCIDPYIIEILYKSSLFNLKY